jgi:hypothetical protein
MMDARALKPATARTAAWRFPPRREFVIETSWPPNVAAIEIRKRIASPYLPARGDEPFIGRSISEDEFRFSRGSSGRSSAYPIVYVAVEPSFRDGARVRVRIQLHDFATALTALPATVGVLLGIILLAHGQPAGLIAVALSAFLAGLIVVSFSRQARETEALVRAIFAAAPGLPPPTDSGEPYR